MEDQEILKLVDTYKNYEGATEFIYAAVEALSFRKKDSDIKWFIKQFFSQNQVTSVDYITCKKLSAHWRNVALDKLNMEDYGNYNYSMITSIHLAIVGKFLESNTFKYQ